MSYAPWNYDEKPDPEAQGEQPQAAQIQHVSRLETWPPQGGQQAVATAPYAAQKREPRTGPWIWLIIGFFVPLVSLITGIWALQRVREGEKDLVPVAVLGIGLTFLSVMMYVVLGA